MVLTQNEKPVYDFLTGHGLTPAAAAGVEGNMMWESGLDPGITNYIGAHGLAQWLGPRRTALNNYAAAHGLSPNSLQANLGYLWQELSTGSGGVTVAGLNAQKTPAAAAAYFDNGFERPGSSDTSLGKRQAFANQIYSQYGGGGSASPIQGGGSDGLTLTSFGSAPQAAPPPTAGSFPTGTDIIGEIDQSMKIQAFDIMHPVNSLTQDAGAISLRIVLVIVGLIIFIFAMIAMVDKAGIVPVPV